MPQLCTQRFNDSCHLSRQILFLALGISSLIVQVSNSPCEFRKKHSKITCSSQMDLRRISFDIKLVWSEMSTLGSWNVAHFRLECNFFSWDAFLVCCVQNLIEQCKKYYFVSVCGNVAKLNLSTKEQRVLLPCVFCFFLGGGVGGGVGVSLSLWTPYTPMYHSSTACS